MVAMRFKQLQQWSRPELLFVLYSDRSALLGIPLSGLVAHAFRVLGPKVWETLSLSLSLVWGVIGQLRKNLSQMIIRIPIRPPPPICNVRTVPQGQKDRVTTLAKSRGPPQSPTETPQSAFQKFSGGRQTQRLPIFHLIPRGPQD